MYLCARIYSYLLSNPRQLLRNKLSEKIKAPNFHFLPFFQFINKFDL